MAIYRSNAVSKHLTKASKLLLLLCLLLPLDSFAQTYSFGVVPQFNARKINAIWQPILMELSKRTGYDFRLTGSATIPAFEGQFMAAEFDFAYMNPYHAFRAAEVQRYIPLVRDVGKTLHGIVVVKKDSNIKSVRDLDGKTVAFPAPNAVGASLIPRADFKNQYHITVKPKYVQSHSSVYLNVALGRVTAGGGVQKTLSRQADRIKNKLRVIYKTREFAPHPVVAHERVPEEVRAKVSAALLAMGRDETSRKLLESVPISKIGPAVLDDYKPLGTWGLEAFYAKE